MKAVLILLFAFALALPGLAAKPPGKKGNKQERQAQKATQQQLREKYDLDKDGKLSKQERSAVSAEDKAKLQELRQHKKSAPKNKKPGTQ